MYGTYTIILDTKKHLTVNNTVEFFRQEQSMILFY